MIRLGAGVATDSRVRVSILIAADLAYKENGGNISRFCCGVSCEVQIVPSTGNMIGDPIGSKGVLDDSA
jgi:hypothetical protein